MNKSVKKALTLILCVTLVVIGGCLLWYGSSNTFELKNSKRTFEEKLAPINPTLIKPMGTFEENTFIDVADVRISYDGNYFFVHNNRADIVRITCDVVGVKNDGTYETLQTIGFYGTDRMQYDRDFQENGWAVEKNTNLVRPGEILQAVLDTSTFVSLNGNVSQTDVDNDGYLDILFMISPQVGENQITSSTDDPKSDVYKIKAP